MKNILVSLVILTCSIFCFGYEYKALPISELLKSIENESFEYKETDFAFGYNKYKSCLYVSDKFAILKDYCVPKKSVAAGYTLFSLKYGIIKLYQFSFKRQIDLITYPSVLADFIKTPIESLSIKNLNKILSSLQDRFDPSITSTNSYNESVKDEGGATSNLFDIKEEDLPPSSVKSINSWMSETQKIVKSEEAWDRLIEKIEDSLPEK